MASRLATDEEVQTWQSQGWVVLPSLVSTEEIDAAADDLNQLFPTNDEYHADPEGETERRLGRPAKTEEEFVWPEEGPGFRPDQHIWQGKFPFPGKGKLNRLCVHSAIVDFAERALGTPDVRLYQAHATAKYEGVTNYEQPMHTDRNHSWLPALGRHPWWNLEGFLYMTDVTEAENPTSLVSVRETEGLFPEYPVLMPDRAPDIYAAEKPATGVRGSYLAYRSDVFHRGTAFAKTGTSRIVLALAFRNAAHEWIGYDEAQSRANSREWTRFVERSTPRELELFGFPPPGHEIWDEALVARDTGSLPEARHESLEERARELTFTGSGDQTSDGSDGDDLPTRFRRHASSIDRAGRSPLTVSLIRGAADDIEAGGILAQLVDGISLPAGQAPALRVVAALHRLVLEGRAPELASYYPDVGGTSDPAAAWQAAGETLRTNAEQVRACLRQGVQTNEPGRSSVLFGVLIWVAERYRIPVDLYEIGASAGLNLLATEYGYHVGDTTLGDRSSALVFDDPWISSPVSKPTTAATQLAVTERRGCDLAPIDAASPEGRLTLLSYIWADEPERLARMRAALVVAERRRPVVDKMPADSWLERLLDPSTARRSTSRVCTIWQSVVAEYLDKGTRSRIDDLLEDVGSMASEDCPLVYARMEPGTHPTRGFGVTVTCWPGGGSQVLAVAGDHGPPVRWTPQSPVTVT